MSRRVGLRLLALLTLIAGPDSDRAVNDFVGEESQMISYIARENFIESKRLCDAPNPPLWERAQSVISFLITRSWLGAVRCR